MDSKRFLVSVKISKHAMHLDKMDFQIIQTVKITFEINYMKCLKGDQKIILNSYSNAFETSSK